MLVLVKAGDFLTMQIDTMAHIFVGGAFLFLYQHRGQSVRDPLPSDASFERRMRRRFDPYCKGLIAACLAMLAILAMLGTPLGEDNLKDALMKFAVLMGLPLLAVIVLPFTMSFGTILHMTPLPKYAVHILTGSLSAVMLPCAIALMGRASLTASTVLLFAIVGAIGGFELWRRMGFPGLARKTADMLGHARDMVGTCPNTRTLAMRRMIMPRRRS